ncbi:hypothetical protein P8452_49133 [Trifolium repens]|nr:hypothetical protein P8452_49133 [Trifolium repens]
MREKDEREWVEKGGRRGDYKQRGYVHRLDQVATSFFFTNFPVEVTAADLWPKFGRFGRVGEVYIPDRLDKQGRRFGFVKYRDVRDPKEQLGLLVDIWVGSYKLRVNLARFLKGTLPKEVSKEDVRSGKEVPTTGVGGKAGVVEGKSYGEALKVIPVARRSGKDPVVFSEEVGGSAKVTWEVEAEAINKLKGSFVGVLSEFRNHQAIQRDFVMGGYHMIKVKPLGHMKVLISSEVEGEVKEIVNSVGWWCTCFERFEEWSPNWVLNQRIVWLNCYGVPLHAWGEAIFKTLGFKFGTFIETDNPTKNMTRVDVAKIKVATDALKMIDSSISVSILDKTFDIRVMEETGSATVDELRCCGGCGNFSDETSGHGSDDGELPAVGEEENEVADIVLTFSGNPLEVVTTKVNENSIDLVGDGMFVCREMAVGSGEAERREVDVSGEICLENRPNGDISPHANLEGGGLDVGATDNLKIRRFGPFFSQPRVLRTRLGDFNVGVKEGGVVNGSLGVVYGSHGLVGGEVLGPGSGGLFPSSDMGQAAGGSLPTITISCLLLPDVGGPKIKKKIVTQDAEQINFSSSGDSDPIEMSNDKGGDGATSSQFFNANGIELEVCLPLPGNKDISPIDMVVPCSLPGQGGAGNLGLGVLLSDSLASVSELPFHGAMVDKERGDVHHVIDIQEDIGMNFKGEGDEDVERSLRFERRDRQLKNDWVQGEGYQ